mmetsp:Transcript_5868/g.19494  ORF Transcript_5868/g.19494 Transcript_5868/m.19494 type:complete len:252 (-) Transcript_5868:106-861(-)
MSPTITRSGMASSATAVRLVAASFKTAPNRFTFPRNASVVLLFAFFFVIPSFPQSFCCFKTGWYRWFTMVFSASRALPLVTPNITSVPGATIAFAPHTRTKYAHCPVTAAPSLPSVSVNTLSGTVALATTWTLLSMFPSAARVLPPPCFNSFSFRVACTAVALLQRRACCGGSRGWYKKISFFPPSASQKSSTFFLNGRSFVSASGSGIPNASAILSAMYSILPYASAMALVARHHLRLPRPLRRPLPTRR